MSRALFNRMDTTIDYERALKKGRYAHLIVRCRPKSLTRESGGGGVVDHVDINLVCGHVIRWKGSNTPVDFKDQLPCEACTIEATGKLPVWRSHPLNLNAASLTTSRGQKNGERVTSMSLAALKKQVAKKVQKFIRRPLKDVVQDNDH